MRTFIKSIVIAFALCLVAVMLSGCAGLNPLNGLTDKPEVTAQVGAENTKQTIGLTAKQDESTNQETTIKESKVDRVDTSSRKQIKAATIQANEIKAETFQVVQGGDTLEQYSMLFALMCFYVAGLLTPLLFRKNKKEA